MDVDKIQNSKDDEKYGKKNMPHPVPVKSPERKIVTPSPLTKPPRETEQDQNNAENHPDVGTRFFLALRGTFWGLRLKALGKNAYSAFLLGVSSERETILAMMFCGALAGLGGAVRVLSWFDSLGAVGGLFLCRRTQRQHYAPAAHPTAFFFGRHSDRGDGVVRVVVWRR